MTVVLGSHDGTPPFLTPIGYRIMAQTTLRQVPALVAARKPFRGNSLRGVKRQASKMIPGATNLDGIGHGRLNAAESARFSADYTRIVYVVASYDTPIAWVLEDGTTYRVAQKFSVTTSKHMGCLYTL